MSEKNKMAYKTTIDMIHWKENVETLNYLFLKV